MFNNATYPTVRPIFTTVAGVTQGIEFTWNGTAGNDLLPELKLVYTCSYFFSSLFR
jgi:hypothetical protein